jgi:hypothetical protein
MTAKEMQYNFELKFGQHDQLDKKFTSHDVDIFLNAAQDDLVEGFYSARVNPQSRYFEMDERARAMMALLIESTVIVDTGEGSGQWITNDSALHENAIFIILPADFLYALEEQCSISYIDCNLMTTTKQSRVLPVTHDEYTINIDNVYKKPWRDLVWRMDFGDGDGKKMHELIYGTDIIINSYRLRYLRTPIAINIVAGTDCELNPILHEEIVDRAVTAAVKSIPQEVEQNLQT